VTRGGRRGEGGVPLHRQKIRESDPGQRGVWAARYESDYEVMDSDRYNVAGPLEKVEVIVLDVESTEGLYYSGEIGGRVTRCHSARICAESSHSNAEKRIRCSKKKKRQDSSDFKYDDIKPSTGTKASEIKAPLVTCREVIEAEEQCSRQKGTLAKS